MADSAADAPEGHNSDEHSKQPNQPKSRMVHANSPDVLTESLESLFEGAQIELMGPGAATLLMQLPVSLRNGVRVQQTVAAGIGDSLRRPATQTLPVDAPIDDDMRDMHALRAVLASEALRD